MSKLFVCEKHSQAQSFQKHCKEGDSIILCPSICSYTFKYPSTLRFSGLPYLNIDPEYAHADFEYIAGLRKRSYGTLYSHDGCCEHPVLVEYYRAKIESNKEDEIEIAQKALFDLLGSYDEIVYACDPDHTGTRGFDFLMSKYFGIKSLEEFSHKYDLKVMACLTLGGLSYNCIGKAISQRESFFESQMIELYRQFYLKKDYFDFNYNINSLLLLNKAYFLASGKYPQNPITRNLIQVMFLLSQMGKVDIRLYRELDLRYVGSPASRCQIIESLKEMGLVAEKSEGRREFSLTELGQRFLVFLHRKMDDPHLAERVMKDCANASMSLEEFRAKSDKYLSLVFSKQKRHINKQS